MSVHVELFKMSARLFDVTIHNLHVGNKWRCTFVYGELAPLRCIICGKAFGWHFEEMRKEAT
jgi:hypothetical protein